MRELLARRRAGHAAATATATAREGLVVPLKLTSADDLSVLQELLRRVAASPALAQACASGLMRFELSIDPAAAAAVGTTAPAHEEGCQCQSPPQPAAAAPMTPMLRGVVTERDVKSIGAGCAAAWLAPRAVLTPLAREALRQRGIAIHAAKEA
ncbi:hypothetical protein UC35_13410 [Ramlibacter tataouinensis]|uniref:Uncharacterized protein n=1 Tax=Ramlibacter tataouinensis TaxID=94132 RepID=A0A127JUI5_9BURK|nr:hypothetical protein UC35_13410 [Ramlibacter tataouinensis]